MLPREVYTGGVSQREIDDFLQESYGDNRMPPPGAETLGEALIDLPNDIADAASDWWQSDPLDGMGTLLEGALAQVQDYLAPALALLGGWPLMLLAFLGIRAVSSKRAKPQSKFAMYAIQSRDLDGFLKYLEINSVTPGYVNAEKGLLTVARSSTGTVDRLAAEYASAKGVTIRRMGQKTSV